jgi:predicted nucleic acid-binding protein
MRVFVDSDVIISSLLSTQGAAYLLLHTAPLTPIISDVSLQEIRTVASRLGIEKNAVAALVKDRLTVQALTHSPEEIQQAFASFVTDPNDAHIVAGAKSATARFLITYNLKHYRRDIIQEQLGVTIIPPARFLQFLRSRS